MDFLFYSIGLFIVFLIITLLISLVLLHFNYLVTCIRKRSESGRIKYFGFLKNKITKRNILIVLIWIPLCLTVVILSPSLVRAPYRTYTLRSELREASKLVIRTGGFCHRHAEREKVLYETNNKGEIEKLINNIAFWPSMPGECLCCGDMSFELYDSKGEFLHGFSFHHDTHIRLQNGSFGDLYLSPRSKHLLDNWLAQKGIREKQREFSKEQQEFWKKQENSE